MTVKVSARYVVDVCVNADRDELPAVTANLRHELLADFALAARREAQNYFNDVNSINCYVDANIWYSEKPE